MSNLVIYTPGSFTRPAKVVVERSGLTKKEKNSLQRDRQIRESDRFQLQRRREQLNRPMADKKQDLSKMELLKIDHRTSIYIPAGADQEAARRRFYKLNPNYVANTEKFRQ